MNYLSRALVALSLAGVACGEGGGGNTEGSESTQGGSSTTSASTTTSDSTTTAATTEADDTTEDGSTTGPDYEVELVDRDCGFEIPAGRSADCYTLIVPEDRTQPEGAGVQLPVVVIHGVGTPSRPPVVYLHGGPGGQAVASASSWFDEGFTEDGDLILLDQRGSGGSMPSLDCPEVPDAWFDIFETNDEPELELQRMRDALLDCRARLAAQVDLDQYHTDAITDDVDDLRVALGIESWTLYGISYGTRVAMASTRRHGEGIHSVVLDSAYPPQFGGVSWMEGNARGSTERIIAGCEAEQGCGSTFVDLTNQLQAGVAALDAAPYPIEVEDAEGQPRSLLLEGRDLQAGLFNGAYDTQTISLIPLLIFSGANGDFSFLDQFADTAFPGLWRLSEGAQMSIDCADAGRLIDEAELSTSVADNPDLATIYLGYPVPFCAAWNVAPRPESFNEPVSNDIPTLIFAGEFDPATPVSQSVAAADSLGNAELFVFPGGGHVITRSHDCGRQMLRSFLLDPEGVDSACWSALSEVTFN